MDSFAPLKLTSAKRPLLEDGETILLTQKDVGLYDGLLWVNEERGKAVQLPLGTVKGIDTTRVG
ncbi:hypothetical protein HK104_004905 [Borealophlyctis nickersoniae]|nr:hypothetical protein HK104_004905 [Borealophlyctis nickersoniae]